MKTNQFKSYLNKYEKIFKSELSKYNHSSINRDLIDSLLSIIVICRCSEKCDALDVCSDDLKFVYCNLSDTSFPKTFYVVVLSFFKLIEKYYG